MGIVRAHLHILGMEHKTHPTTGRCLVLGQQAVYATCNEVASIFSKYDVPLRKLPSGFDTSNKIPTLKGTSMDKFTNCKTVMTLLGAEKVEVCDVSDYENPDFLLNLNIPVDTKYHAKFDCIVSFGTLEHVFDIPQALENIDSMLRPGGVLMNMTPTSNAVNHGFYSISPTLYLDYFEANGYTELAFYLTNVRGERCQAQTAVYRLERELAWADLCHLNHLSEVIFLAKKPEGRVQHNKKEIVQSLYTRGAGWVSGRKGDSKPEEADFLKKLWKNLPADIRVRMPYDFMAQTYASIKHPIKFHPKYMGKF